MTKIADSTVRRLSLYLSYLEGVEREGRDTISSAELAGLGGTTSAQVRKDLSLFGSFGKRGLGYSVEELARHLRDILGLERTYRVAVVGAGKLGSALAQYRAFGDRGFAIVSVYDSDPERIGKRWNGLQIKDTALLDEDLRSSGLDIAILTTPPEVAQAEADRLVRGGVKGIMNFTSVRLEVPEHVAVKNVNMALELQALSYALRHAHGGEI